jgi:TolB-like protein/DNA-binding winged helix-turn-helix (wHTH) protein/Tfp pilus assembly protein PilF
MLTLAESPHIARFGDFEVDLHTAEVRQNGRKFILQGQPFQVLIVLLERPGELVTREELKKRLWSSDTFVDFDHSLNKAVNRLRETLSDSPETPKYIETLPRRGYRFIATVVLEARDVVERSQSTAVSIANANQEDVSSTPKASRDQFRAQAAKKWWLWLIAAGALVAGAIPWAFHSSPKIDGAVTIRSLAVLPLENISGNPSQDYFADGMTDELITQFAQIRSLRVVSRTSVMQYKGIHKPLPQIAHELNVDAIVEGTVLTWGDQVRITAQLIEGPAEKHLWAQSYRGNVQDVLGLQNQIASAIGRQIQSALSAPQQLRMGVEQPVNPEAYESYLRGEYLLNRLNPESVRAATNYFQKSIDLDPAYAPAYAKLAGCYQILGNMGILPARETHLKAQSLIAKALVLDPQFAAAHAVRGWGLQEYDFDFVRAGAEFKRAVELNPNGVEGHHGLATYYAATGAMHESVLEMQQARQLDPLSTILNDDLCRMLYFARRYDEALAQCQANLDLNPNSAREYWMVGDVYAAKRMNSEAISAFLKALQVLNAPARMVTATKSGAEKSGIEGYWKALVHFAPENVAKGNLTDFDAAVAYSYAGETDEAITWLEKAVEGHNFGVAYLGVDPVFDRLRSEPRFAALLKRINIAQHLS